MVSKSISIPRIHQEHESDALHKMQERMYQSIRDHEHYVKGEGGTLLLTEALRQDIFAHVNTYTYSYMPIRRSANGCKGNRLKCVCHSAFCNSQ